MIFEHFAVNVKDTLAVRDWYCEHLGLQVVREMKEPPYVNFLADSSGRVIVEFYTRPESPITDYAEEHPLSFHFAFVSKNTAADRDRLISAGATFIEEVTTEDGSHIAMLRDPWGLTVQLCQRTDRLYN